MDGVVWIGRTKVPFRCVASQRVKTARIEVAGSEVIITYPTAQNISHETAEALILAKKRWLIEKLSHANDVQLKPSTTLPLLRSGMKIMHYGHERLVAVEVADKTSIELSSHFMKLTLAPGSRPIEEVAKSILIDWQNRCLKETCEKILNPISVMYPAEVIVRNNPASEVEMQITEKGGMVLKVSASLIVRTEREIQRKVEAAFQKFMASEAGL